MMDCIGYSQRMIEIRQLAFKIQIAKINEYLDGRCVLVGSKGEGISKQLETDFDYLLFLNNTTCFDDPMRLPALSDVSETIFLMRYTHPGYCVLECVKMGTNESVLNSLVPFQGKTMLSGEVLCREERKIVAFNGYQTGPAITARSPQYPINADFVLTFGFDSQNALHDWQRRHRQYGWPPLSTRKAISEMRGNLVAKGLKGSETESLEWRLCFGEIELLIVQAFNDTQMKLYKLLKIINTDILKMNGHSVSSYMMKNVAFWLAENNSPSMFSPNTLFSWIVEALRKLKLFVEVNYLPYYMIPGRNLLVEKIGESERVPLQRCLTDLIQAGPNILYRCKTFAQKLLMNPRDLRVFREKNDAFECYFLLSVHQIPLECLNIQGIIESSRVNGDRYPEVYNSATKFLMSSQGQELLQTIYQDIFGR